MVTAQQIRGGLKALRETDRKRIVFGARAHGYKLGPKLTEDELGRVEKTWGFRAPDDYREFLLEVGNGGAGPGYGIYRFGTYPGDGQALPWDGDILGDLTAPFSLREAWNEPPSLAGAPEDEQQRRALLQRELRRYYVEATNGAIPICSTGDEFERVWLIVTGPEAGFVWRDRRGGTLEGLAPLLHPATSARMTFVEWYMAWVARSLQALKQVHR